MSLNDTLKLCLLVLMLSLSAFILSTTAYMVHKILTVDKLEVKIDGKFDGTYLQDEVVNAIVNTNIMQDEHP